MSVYRPNGVKVIIVFFILISILGFLLGLQPTATDPGYTDALLTDIAALSYTYTHLPLIFNALSKPEYALGYIGLFFFLNNTTSDLILLPYMPPLCLISEILSGAFLVSTVGLLLMKKWGQRLGLIMGATLIAGGIIIFIPSTIPPAAIPLILPGIAIIWYLNKVRDYFG